MNAGLCFNDVLPYDGRPAPLVKRDGKYYLRLKEVGATKVQMAYAEAIFDFTNTGDDIWEIRLPFKSAINYVQIIVDGRETLEAVLPVTYGYSRIYNCIELPVEGEDFYALNDVPHGSVRKEYFFSKVTGEWESCMVYTPAEYDENPDKIYPVLYLQHGHGENELGWTISGKANLIMDNLIAEKKAVPFVIVMNNGMVQKKVSEEDEEAVNPAHIVDHLLFEPMLIEDVIPFIEGKYHVGGSRENRGMAGLSMGSIQTSMIVCNHPEMFSEAGVFSGFLRDWISSSELDMSCHEPSKDQHLKAMEDAEKFNNSFNTFFRAIGEADPFMEHFLSDDEFCREHGINCTRQIYEGTHDWNVWRMCLRDFAQLIFRN
jgi:enterochelin esterase family protein